MKFSVLVIAAAILASTPVVSNAGAAPAASARPGAICVLATLGLPIACRPH